MNQLISATIALHVLVHSVLGCCGHVSCHARPAARPAPCHAAAGHHESQLRSLSVGRECSAATSEASEIAATADNACGPGAAAPQPGSAPDQPLGCRHELCHWQTPAATTSVLAILADQAGHDMSLFVVAPPAVAESMSSGNAFRRLASIPVRPSGMRLHLALQVLLI